MHAGDGDAGGRGGLERPAAECARVIQAGDACLAARVADAATYKLITAVNVLSGAPVVPHRYWRLTYKLRARLPASPDQPVGAGGEVFVLVDALAGEARVSGYGE